MATWLIILLTVMFVHIVVMHRNHHKQVAAVADQLYCEQKITAPFHKLATADRL